MTDPLVEFPQAPVVPPATKESYQTTYRRNLAEINAREDAMGSSQMPARKREAEARQATYNEKMAAFKARPENGPKPVAKKSLGVAVLLWFFLGLFGAHRFYLGFWKSGLVRLFTLNFLGVGWVIDSILVVHLYNKRDGWLDGE